MNEFNEASYQGYYIQPRVCCGGGGLNLFKLSFNVQWLLPEIFSEHTLF